MYRNKDLNEDYETSIKQARARVVLILKEGGNQPQRRETIEYKLMETFPVDFDRVFRSEPQDEYQIQMISDPMATHVRYRLKTPDITNKHQLLQYIRDSTEGVTISFVILSSCYSQCGDEIRQLEKQGDIIVYPQVERGSDKVLIMSRDCFFKTKDEFDYFKGWFGSDYRAASQKTIDCIKTQRMQNEQHQVIHRENTNNCKVVNTWIFPNGLPQEQQKRK